MAKKPKFDPNKPFEPVGGGSKSKPAFDPNRPYEPVREERPEGELAPSTRAALSFASNMDEKRAYLEQEYPGTEFRKTVEGEDLVKLPGEGWKYMDDPSVNWTDVVDFTGDGAAGIVTGGLMAIPGVGPVAGAGFGSALGEGARKAIGRGLLKIPDKASGTEDMVDIGTAGLLGAGGAWVGRALFGGTSAMRQGIKEGLEEAPQFGTKPYARDAVEEGIEAPLIGGELGGRSGDESRGLVSKNDDFVLGQRDQALPAGSLDEMDKAVEHGKKLFGLDRSVTLQRLDEIERIIPDFQFKPTNYHRYMLGGKTKENIAKSLKELPSEDAQILNDYDVMMKHEAVERLRGFIRGIGTEAPLEKTQAGDNFLTMVDQAYQKNKKALGPLFEDIKKTRIAYKNHIPQLMDRLVMQNPKFHAITEAGEGGVLKIKPFRPKMGLSKKEYRAYKSIIDEMNSGEMTIPDLMNTRDFLRKMVDPVNHKETSEIVSLRKTLLDHIEDLVAEKKPDLNVRETFQKYAKNEKALEDIQQIIGGKVDDIDSLRMADREKVLDKIFSSQKAADRVKQIIGKERFDNLVASALDDLIEKHTDSTTGYFSSKKFFNDLGRKGQAFSRHLSNEQKDYLMALVDYMKLVPDAGPMNTSKTAIAKETYDILNPKSLLQGVRNSFNASGNRRRINKMLSTDPKKMSEPPRTPIMGPGARRARGLLPPVLAPSMGRGYLTNQEQ